MSHDLLGANQKLLATLRESEAEIRRLKEDAKRDREFLLKVCERIWDAHCWFAKNAERRGM